MSDNAASPLIAALAAWTPSPAPSLAPPAHIFAGYDVPAHFAALYSADAFLCGSPFRTVAAYVTAARLWTPPRADFNAAMATLDASDDPLARAKAWVLSLPADVMECVAGHAVIAADHLREDLADARALDVSDGGYGVASWLCDRDDLTSVTIALMWAGRGEHFRNALAALDTHARPVFMPRIASQAAEITADARLRAVAWQEPDSLVAVVVSAAYECESVR